MRAVFVGLVVTALVGVSPLAQRASAAQCADPTGPYTGQSPWGQRLVDPARIWPLTTGSGQIVAVVGAGVDAANAQFAPGQVLPARDVTPGGGTAEADCDGRGTIAAGVVAAKQNSETTFAGVAPDVKILPVRYRRSTENGDPAALAAGIDAAVQDRAGVILIAVPAAADSPALASAVDRARESGSLVVSPAAATEDGRRSYPTATPGVLAVGSTKQNGEPAQAESGDYIGISAPGADLVSTSAGAGGALAHRFPVTDPSLAAAYVAGAAALVRSYHPGLTPEQVVTRLTLTANRPPSGGRDPQRGWGMLDAYAAVSAEIPADAVAPGGLPDSVARGAMVPALADERPATDRFSGFLALAGVGLAAAAGVAVLAVRRGRARSWRPSRR
ncbi:S8 family serine peptidase [Amycolatopsis sp.]|uniref:S8 family serine peptidase n=1 Tax=Amycolatopsis sp. TaxID=37632 RepID=UPI002DFBD906|nr:S8 family serine peptidase [Amycolatopsis sp.]